MELYVLPARRLRVSERRFIADHLTRPNSDFQNALLTGEPKGTIAVCFDHGEIIGWARTEMWQEMPTLEAFVSTAYRRRGVATACAAALVADDAYADHHCAAVFRPLMAKLAHRLGLLCIQFDRKPDGTWTPAR